MVDNSQRASFPCRLHGGTGFQYVFYLIRYTFATTHECAEVTALLRACTQHVCSEYHRISIPCRITRAGVANSLPLEIPSSARRRELPGNVPMPHNREISCTPRRYIIPGPGFKRRSSSGITTVICRPCLHWRARVEGHRRIVPILQKGGFVHTSI